MLHEGEAVHHVRLHMSRFVESVQSQNVSRPLCRSAVAHARSSASRSGRIGPSPIVFRTMWATPAAGRAAGARPSRVPPRRPRRPLAVCTQANGSKATSWSWPGHRALGGDQRRAKERIRLLGFRSPQCSRTVCHAKSRRSQPMPWPRARELRRVAGEVRARPRTVRGSGCTNNQPIARERLAFRTTREPLSLYAVTETRARLPQGRAARDEEGGGVASKVVARGVGQSLDHIAVSGEVVGIDQPVFAPPRLG